jgi:hypothetical protein
MYRALNSPVSPGAFRVGDIGALRQVPSFVHGHGANAAFEVSLAEEVLTTAAMHAPLHPVGHIRVAALILRLVELATLQCAAKQETKQLSRHDNLIDAPVLRANGFDVLLNHMIERNKHVGS